MKKELKEKDYFKSSDICLVSALSTFGYQIESIDTQNKSRAVFSIENDKKLDGLIHQYFTHKLRVEPLSFFNALKEIKTRLYHT
ncbi:MAG: DUF5659 domain-containing protein [bacterium]